MRNRSTIDLMILLLTATVCLAILFTGAYLAVLKLTNPGQDTTSAQEGLTSMISGVLGALLGLLAGKSDKVVDTAPPPAPQPQPQTQVQP